MSEYTHPDSLARSRASVLTDAAGREAADQAEHAKLEVQRRAVDRSRVVVGRVGTRQGRMVEVVRYAAAGVVQIVDPSVPHHGGVLVEVNTDQGQELVAVLSAAIGGRSL